MEVRRVSEESRVKLPGGHPGVFGAPIVMDERRVPVEARERLDAPITRPCSW